MYTAYTFPVAVIVLLLLMMFMNAHFIRRIESFEANAGYYLSGDGSWAGQMRPADANADGSTGLVPAPLAGQHNSYLRGDGKWVQPTAAHYLYSVASAQTTTSNLHVIQWPTSGNPTEGTAISQLNNTVFTILPGYTYKIIADISSTMYPDASERSCYLTANAVQIGNIGGLVPVSNENHWTTSSTCVAYIQPTVSTAISFIVVCTLGALTGHKIKTAWISIEVISNNNIITQFAGSSESKQGTIGYIPAPAAGQQKHVLTGAGTWTKLGLGITGEKWNDLSGTRKPGVLYTNTYSYPIVVSLTATTGSASGYLSLHVGGVEAVLVSSYDPSNPHSRYNTLSAIVPPGSTYVFKLPGGDSSLNRWSELY